MKNSLHMSVALRTVARGLAPYDIHGVTDAIIAAAFCDDVMVPAATIIDAISGMGVSSADELVRTVARGYVSYQLDGMYDGRYHHQAQARAHALMDRAYYRDVMYVASMALSGIQGAYVDALASSADDVAEVVLFDLARTFGELALFLDESAIQDDVNSIMTAYRYVWEGTCPPPPAVGRAWAIARELADLADSVAVTSALEVPPLDAAACAFRTALYRRRPPLLPGMAYKMSDLDDALTFVANFGDRAEHTRARTVGARARAALDNLGPYAPGELGKTVVFYYMMVGL